MHWNYRIFEHVTEKETTFALHECHYDEHGHPNGWSENPECGHFESVDGLLKSMRLMMQDAERSCGRVLSWDDGKPVKLTTPAKPR